jgi:hypothetical protein
MREICSAARPRRLRGGATALVAAILFFAHASAQRGGGAPRLFPASGSSGVNPDTQLVLTFDAPPALGTSGLIRVIDQRTRAVVDTIDIGIPPAGQRTVIGGFAEGFHFYPVIVRGTTATISLHHDALRYGRTYEVHIDAGVFSGLGVPDLTASLPWRFSTRSEPPAGADRLVVARDGSGDFNTVQGAVDAIPAVHAGRVTVFIRRGRYEEIVYMRGKHDITFEGEDRDGVVIGYANNERFNGPPPGVATNEKPDTFPYRRAAFMADRSSGIQLVNLTIENFTPAGGSQAEALLLSGGRNVVRRVTLRSHQDTAQFNDSVFVEDALIEGDTDFLWGRGPAFFRDTTLRDLSDGPFMWVRSTAASHGFVFEHCRFETAPGHHPFLARNTAAYPASEIVLLDSRLGDIHPLGWSLPDGIGPLPYLEFASLALGNDVPADVSRRHPASRQLDAAADAALIRQFRDPAFVLGGWRPDDDIGR